jgi:hypothetical protein
MAADGNWYDFVPFVWTWGEAGVHASSQIWQGMQGHLATQALAEGNAFVSQLPALVACAAGAQCRQRNILGFWLGGVQSSDAFDPSVGWHWITWEIWDIFESQWRPGEPNDFGAGEDRLSLTLDAQWNDLNAQQVLEGYIIEYDYHSRVQWRVEDGGNGHW